MTRKGDQAVRALAFEECCNYLAESNGNRHVCLARADHRCVFASDDDMPRCGWFEKAVLPLDPELQAVYFASRKAAAHGQKITALQVEVARESVRGGAGRRRRAG